MTGAGVDQDGQQAVQWWLKAAEEEGYAPSFTILGRAFTEGVGGVAEDLDRAFGYFMQGAKRGDPNGCTELARCYTDGDGCPTDLEAAATWEAKAQELGSE